MLSPEEEKKEFKPLFESKNKQGLERGENWYVISARWFDQWKEFVDYDADDNAPSQRKTQVARPSPMNNFEIVEGNKNGFAILKKGIQENYDYTLLPQDCFNKLFVWYGGQPKIEREVIELSNFTTRIELFPLSIRIKRLPGNECLDCLMSTTVTVGNLREKACKHFQIESDNLRVWTGNPQQTVKSFQEVRDLSNTLEDLVIDHLQIFVLSVDETWMQNTELRKSKNDLQEIPTSTADPMPLTWQQKREIQEKNIQDYPFQEKKKKKNHHQNSQDEKDYSSSDDDDDDDSDIFVSAESKMGDDQDQEMTDFQQKNQDVNTAAVAADDDEKLEDDKPKTEDSSFFNTARNIISSATSAFWGASNNRTGNPPGPGLTGLMNLGNTCFMNSALQCLSATSPLTNFFLSKSFEADINRDNPLGMKGELAECYASLLEELYSQRFTAVYPSLFKKALGRFAPQFSGFQQQDSQELLAFLLDGIHEDLNRVRKKPVVESVEDDGSKPDAVVAQLSWDAYLKRNQSIIVDLFQGQFKSTVVCPQPDCGKISVTYDPFMYLSCPLPKSKTYQEVSFMFRRKPKQSTEESEINEKEEEKEEEKEKKPKIPPNGVIKFSIELDRRANFRDLRRKLAELTGVAVENMTMTEVKDSKIAIWQNDQKQIASIRNDDVIYGYEVLSPQEKRDELLQRGFNPPPASEIEIYYLHLFHKKNGQQFGTPHVISMAKGFTSNREFVREITDTLISFYLPNINPNTPYDKLKELFEIFLVHQDTSKRPLLENDEPCMMNLQREIICIHWTEEGAKQKEKLKINIHESCRTLSNFNNTLIDCIELFTKKEKLTSQNSWYCNRCKEHREATKQFQVWSFPNILVIQLKRFQYNSYWQSKIDTDISFPINEPLDLSQFELCKDKQTPPIYQLFAVSNHMGGMGGGHYTAYAKHQGSWYSFDDSSVSSISSNHVESTISGPEAYVLFFRRVGFQDHLWESSNNNNNSKTISEQ